MMPVVRTVLADEDLLDIWFYISADNVEAADRVLDRIDARCESLGHNPEMGTQRDELMPGMRCLVEGNYIIFYRIRPNCVEVLRILHGSRDFPSMF
ncbi:type II toxin-antitoxin system RelE/ParE family toxin [Alkalinema pantanalense CENA528]|uniref:type II toxin-antitoxin system RelE/ParE family toxin n=1 Tax=Alkalinema pantanalense TaxID=1620705 RepID=UPI003D6E41B1